jgi:eukaryotic-like serine/threonine-protein kinase
MAPELLDDVEFTAQSDLYALGVVLFEMLAGPPFRGHSALELLAMHAKLPAPTLAARGVDVPAPVEALVADLLAKAPSDRPSSAQLVLERLGAVDVTRVEKMALRSTTLEAPAEEVTVRTPFARVRR